MSEPSTERPVPGPPRPAAPTPEEPDTSASDRFGDLERRPVSEHVAAYEAEHERLRRELGTIDQL